MASVSLDLRIDNGKLLLALNKAPQLLERNMSNAINRIIQNIGRSARIAAPKAFSTLTNSILPVMVTPLHGEVRTGTNYARYVEEGTRASGKMPPLDELISWIRVKGIQPNDPGMSERSLAFVIARSIARSGTPAQPYMASAIRDNQADARKRASRAIQLTLEAMA